MESRLPLPPEFKLTLIDYHRHEEEKGLFRMASFCMINDEKFNPIKELGEGCHGSVRLFTSPQGKKIVVKKLKSKEEQFDEGADPEKNGVKTEAYFNQLLEGLGGYAQIKNDLNKKNWYVIGAFQDGTPLCQYPFESQDTLSFLKIYLSVFKAIRKIYELGFNHGDCRFKNILISPTQAKLIDFADIQQWSVGNTYWELRIINEEFEAVAKHNKKITDIIKNISLIIEAQAKTNSKTEKTDLICDYVEKEINSITLENAKKNDSKSYFSGKEGFFKPDPFETSPTDASNDDSLDYGENSIRNSNPLRNCVIL